jgi:hypothetical protein
MNVKALGVPIYPANDSVPFEHVRWADLKLALDKEHFERLYYSGMSNDVVSVKWLEGQR